jgi:hypothetical protein
MRSLALAAILALALAPPAMAKNQCRDAHGKFTPCPATSKSKSSSSSLGYNSTGGPHCTTGKPCGKSCIAKDKVCHK